MAIMITETFFKELIKHRALDKKMITSMAEDFVKQKDAIALARYLLTKEIAVNLLTERLMKNPIAEIRFLDELPSQKGAPSRRGRPPKAKKAEVVQPKRGRGRPPKAEGVKVKEGSRRKRKRLSSGKSDKLKTDIREFLKANPGSSRLQILAALKIPSAAIYNRLMVSLKQANEIVAQGEKRNAVYFLK